MKNKKSFCPAEERPNIPKLSDGIYCGSRLYSYEKELYILEANGLKRIQEIFDNGNVSKKYA